LEGEEDKSHVCWKLGSGSYFISKDGGVSKPSHQNPRDFSPTQSTFMTQLAGPLVSGSGPCKKQQG
jgi:hypothetical protein